MGICKKRFRYADRERTKEGVRVAALKFLSIEMIQATKAVIVEAHSFWKDFGKLLW